MEKTNFFKFENEHDDFPFYNEPSSIITIIQGLFLLIISIGSVIAFQYIPFPNFLAPFVNIIFPLGAFIFVVKSNWTKLFRKIHVRDIKVIIIAYVACIIYAFIGGIIVLKLFGGNANPIATTMQNNSAIENIVMLLKTIPMLFGEELITIIPFLVILQFATNHLKSSRKHAVIIAWIVTALIFGALHLPTYKWNIGQAVIGIGVSRLILTYTYMKTKNIWISFLVHVLNDWTLFLIAIIPTK